MIEAASEPSIGSYVISGTCDARKLATLRQMPLHWKRLAQVNPANRRRNGGKDWSCAKVWVRNRAEVPNYLLSQAQAEVQRIFRKAGVATVWIAAPHDKGSSQESPLIIDILSRDEANRLNVTRSAETLGAAPTSGFERGRVAYPFYHRIGDPSRESGVNRRYVLGIAMAHELGHLLLAYGSHSRRH